MDRQLAVVDEEGWLSWMRVASQHPGLGALSRVPYEGPARGAAFNTPAAAVTDALLP